MEKKPEKKIGADGSRRSPMFKIAFGLIVIVSIAGLAKIYIWPGFGKKEPEAKKDNYKDGSVPGSRYHYRGWSGNQEGYSGRDYDGAAGRPATPPGPQRYSAPSFRTSQQINPKEDPEGFLRTRFEESPWLWEKASPEDKEKIFEQFREKMLQMKEMNKSNSTGTGMGMGKKIHEQRWAGRDKKGGKHGRRRQDSGEPVINNMSGENQSRGAEGRPGIDGKNWDQNRQGEER